MAHDPSFLPSLPPPSTHAPPSLLATLPIPSPSYSSFYAIIAVNTILRWSSSPSFFPTSPSTS
ncbi:hypothetical protein PM082_010001 [Marasmius tenuissimus]|nr:hypothetical protein PM082_010001 [Marasmius tenuissimus]